MKTSRANPLRTFAIAAAFLATQFVPSEAGLIDLMKGEPQGTKPGYQRVAFVGSAEVKEASGEVERLVGIDSWKPLEAGQVLSPGDVVRTRQGVAVLKMKDSGSFVRVTPNTMLRLVVLERSWDRAALSGSKERAGFVVRACRGKAFALTAGNWQPLEVNSVLPAGARVRTEPDSVLDLYNTKTKRAVRIEGGSFLTLDDKVLAGRRLVRPDLVASSLP